MTPSYASPHHTTRITINRYHSPKELKEVKLQCKLPVQSLLAALDEGRIGALVVVLLGLQHVVGTAHDDLG